jgi:hypothetical protein
MTLAKCLAAFLAAGICHAAPAAAGDYPFSGDLTIAGDPENADPLDSRRCALNFFRQGLDGKFTAYHVDLPRFRLTREVKYLVYQHGACAFDEKARIESCHMAFDTDPESREQVYVDVIETMDDAYVRTTSFEDFDQAEEYVKTGMKGDSFGISYFRCAFDAAKRDAALTDQVSTLELPERDLLTAPDAEFLGQEDVANIAREMGLEK